MKLFNYVCVYKMPGDSKIMPALACLIVENEADALSVGGAEFRKDSPSAVVLREHAAQIPDELVAMRALLLGLPDDEAAALRAELCRSMGAMR